MRLLSLAGLTSTGRQSIHTGFFSYEMSVSLEQVEEVHANSDVFDDAKSLCNHKTGMVYMCWW